MEFGIQNEKMEAKQSAFDDAMDMMDPDANGEAAEIYEGILGEIGLEAQQKMQVGTKQIKAPAAQQ